MASFSEPAWTDLNDESLLKQRICDLRLSISGSELEPRVASLYSELKTKGLGFEPKVYLGDEWFSPEGVNAIAIPFYLAHPRLIALQKKILLEAEGETEAWCQKLLRHEAGHCFDHSFGFSKRRKWREIFGSPNEDYHPEHYRPKPYSRSFVKHIDNWYAQAHPDEDFAETFAVWLTPGLDWAQAYRRWPMALAKLKYLESLSRETKGKIVKPPKLSRLPFDASRMKTTLASFYAKRKKENAERYPDFFDTDLRRIFNGSTSLSLRQHSALKFMKKNKRELIEILGFHSGEKRYAVSGLIRRLELRCQELELRMNPDETRSAMELGAFLATLISHHLFTGKFKRSV